MTRSYAYNKIKEAKNFIAEELDTVCWAGIKNFNFGSIYEVESELIQNCPNKLKKFVKVVLNQGHWYLGSGWNWVQFQMPKTSDCLSNLKKTRWDEMFIWLNADECEKSYSSIIKHGFVGSRPMIDIDTEVVDY